VKSTAKRKQNVTHDVTLINRTTTENYKGDLIGDDEIDGKSFYVLQVGARVMKLSKEGYELQRQAR
jgi:hypothetical protein